MGLRPLASETKVYANSTTPASFILLRILNFLGFH